MKRRLLLSLFTFSLLAASALSCTPSHATEGGRCTGKKYCTACKNCRYCKHCAKDGGRCGICTPSRR
ncbi:MAG: hypothetical protein HXN06_05205 [Porphyromonadaceae bacterium]|uniref:hypothetical protein n=1 Tax=uncultured Porphyromonas sp. TaxID=159274 RepID=UPI001CAF6BEB|nr:hypothetical protein [uncultured Porphyromonas sp.]MBF1312504.1 hypothetical protein [Porphyromonadaceae bacterium]